jgi:hypothetical protein
MASIIRQNSAVDEIWRWGIVAEKIKEDLSFPAGSSSLFYGPISPFSFADGPFVQQTGLAENLTNSSTKSLFFWVS